MIGNQWPYAVAALLFAAGMWQMLPRGHVHSRRPGIGLTAVGLALLVLLVHFGLIFTHAAPYVQVTSELPRLGGWIEDGVFLVLAGVTVISAVGAVSMRSPVYCAIWFAMTLLGTAGLFFYQGAQFLGVATVVVYAGAILVTFLFVLMLANPEGFARYDRMSWEGMLSACAGAVMVGMLTMTTATALQPRDKAGVVETTAWETSHASLDRNKNVLQDQHVARLGGELFSKQLIAVEVAGTLLMVALVGAVAIVSYSSSKRRSPTSFLPEGPGHG